MRLNKQKGVSLLLGLLIITAISAIAFGLSRLALGQLKLSRDISKSVIAFFAADSGVERALYEERIEGEARNVTGCIDVQGEICYNIQVSGSSPNKTISSNGSYDDILRAIEITF